MSMTRIARVRRELRERGLDSLIVSSLVHIRYLTGFTGSNALLLITPRSTAFLSDVRYALQAPREVKGCKRIIITQAGLYEEAAARGLLDASGKTGFESHQITYAQYRMLKRLFPGTSFASTSDIVENVMLVKDPGEVELIRRAAQISDRVFDEMLGKIRPGISELEIAAEISYLHKRFGAQRDAFEIIVASGSRGAFPHARASRKKIRSGELVTLDFGCVIDGYNSDMTRTVAVGNVNSRAKHIYQTVRDAQQQAIEAARGSMKAKDLDAIARRRIERSGFGKYFNHSLGHGLGLQVHERPKVSQLSRELLRSGSVITIEPGVYIPEFGGVRIEDDVVLSDNGCEVLNAAPKELIVL